MKSSHLLGIAVAGALGVVSSASAADKQPLDDRFYIAPMASYSFFDNNTFEPDDEAGGQISVGKTLTKHLALELYAFNFNGTGVEPNSGNVDVTGYGVSALLFPARDILPVFGIVGIGEGEHDFDKVNTPSNLNNQDSDFVDLGIGFVHPITDYGVALRGEYRYRSSDVDAPGGGEYGFHDNVVSLGVQVPLGAKPQAEPEPVTEPEPQPAPEPPPEPTDSDGDGVPDDRDRCPGTPSDTEVNRFGCPVEKSEPIVLKGVTFEYDSATLTSQAEERLDTVVSALRNADQIDVQVHGHTDSKGPASYNLKLSEKRADSVKDYLVGHGIDADRLATDGFGETRPVAPNTQSDGSDNPEGRAKNRRVELHVVDEDESGDESK